jgi:hypothetical protein
LGLGVERVEGRLAVGEKLKVFSELDPGRGYPVTVTEVSPGRGMTWRGGMPLGLFKGIRTYRLMPRSTSSPAASRRASSVTDQR